VALETFLSRCISAVRAPPRAGAGPAAQAVVVEPAHAPISWQREAPSGVEANVGEDVNDVTERLGSPTTQHVEAALFNPAEPVPAAPPAEPVASGTRPMNMKRWIAVAAAALIVGTAGVASYEVLGRDARPAMATLSVQSNPTGIPVFVDGVERGITPARLTLAPGSHILELRRGVPRVIPVTLTAGADVSQYLEFPGTPVAPEAVTPPVAAARTSAAAEPAAAGAPLAGWVSAQLPFTVEIRENGSLLGTTDVDRLMLASGMHQLDFVNEALGYQESRTIEVVAGRVTSIPLVLPNGTVNLNASPWAEVWLDGVRVGDTPIANLAVPIGAHEIVFRHPQFGEKRHAVSVTAGVPVRISVEMK
jgi:hypothetical protein